MPPTVDLGHLPPEALDHVANYFRSLSEPMRLRILSVLRTGELSVSEIADAIASSTANTSRHLSQMAQLGLVVRDSRGTSAYYRIADPGVYQLCDLVCSSIGRRFETAQSQHALFAAPRSAAKARATPKSRAVR